MCRLYPFKDGHIYINGQEISTITQASLRRCIGVVPQDTVLFNDTLYYNISYGNVAGTNKSGMTVEQASKEANIYDFIMSTPDGFNTRVGER